MLHNANQKYRKACCKSNLRAHQGKKKKTWIFFSGRVIEDKKINKETTTEAATVKA